MAIIGIDLGTTNSLIGVFEDGKPRLIANARGGFLTPSAVAVDASGEIIVGAAAKEIALKSPDTAVMSFKRWMGTDKLVQLGKKSFRAEELSSFVLRSLMADFEAQVGAKAQSAVISCPAYFNDGQRKATIHAAQLAGLQVERLVNEPTAAVLAYGLETAAEGQFLVFDLGGGTFDVSVMHKYDGVFEIRASAGDNYLGGDDFTEALLKMLLRKAALDATALKREDLVRILRGADAIKTELSNKLDVEYRITTPNLVLEGLVTRDDYEIECMDLLRRLRQPLERALRDSDISPDNLDAIILVGGATRMPMIRQTVARLFGKLPYVNINPDEVVAMGAVIQSALKARNEAVEDVLLTDVCPFTLGTEVSRTRPDGKREEVVYPLIERNAVVPISRVETFHTMVDKQAAIAVNVYQGENLRPEHNVKIGGLTINVPPRPAGEESVDIRFTYDINGALEVEVTANSTKQVQKAIFANTSGLDDAQLTKRFAELAALKLAPRDQQENRELISRAERLYAEALDADRQMISHALLDFQSTIDSQRIRDMDSVRKDFRAFLERFDTFVFIKD